MLFCLQIALYCLLFFLLVKCAVKNDGRNCLYFYPTAYIDEAQRRGLAEHGDVMRRGKRFMIPFCAVMLIALVLIVIGALNWGSVGFFGFDCVAFLFGGQMGTISRIIYALVGVAGLWGITMIFRDDGSESE